MERDSYAPGTPSWVDISAPDTDAAASFYTQLFGWECEDAGPVEETGGYRMFTQGGRNVAGLGPHADDNPAPPSWSTYISSDDADKTAELVTANRGTVIVPVMDVMDAGRMFFAMDPTGAAFGVWQPKEHIGAQLCNEPVSFAWNELNSRDIDAATAFYTAVFGWEANRQEGGPTGTYIEMKLDGAPVAGITPMAPEVPPMVPSFWLTYFAVADTDATLAEATQLGGTLVVPAMDIPPGRFGITSDPNGAQFAVIKLAEGM